MLCAPSWGVVGVMCWWSSRWFLFTLSTEENNTTRSWLYCEGRREVQKPRVWWKYQGGCMHISRLRCMHISRLIGDLRWVEASVALWWQLQSRSLQEERKDTWRSSALIAQMGKGTDSIGREGVDVVPGDAGHGWTWQCWVHGWSDLRLGSWLDWSQRSFPILNNSVILSGCPWCPVPD